MKDGFGEITEEITDERKDYISYKMEIIFSLNEKLTSTFSLFCSTLGTGGGS